MCDTGNEKQSLYRDLNKPVIVYRNIGETPFVSVPHLHTQFEIYYNIKGGKSFFVNNSFYACEPYDLIVIPSTQIHKAVIDRNVLYDRCIINIDEKIIALLKNMPNMQSFPLSWLDDIGVTKPHKVKLSLDQHMRYLHMIAAYNKLEDAPDELLMLAKLLEILSFVGEKFKMQTLRDVQKCEPQTRSDKVIHYIESNFRKDISVTDIAGKMYVSEYHLCRIFKAETNMTIKQYMTARKIAEAKKLLYFGASVRAACELSGFNDCSNFIRTFKKEEGYPPGRLEKLTDPL